MLGCCAAPDRNQPPPKARAYSPPGKQAQNEAPISYQSQDQQQINSNVIVNVAQKDRIDQIYSYSAQRILAEEHKRAVAFGYNPRLTESGKSPTRCPCCQNPINTVSLPICYGTTPSSDSSEEFLLDSGSSYFFTFIKSVILYLVLRFLIADLFNIFTSSTQGQYCSKNPTLCNSAFSYFSSFNQRDGYSSTDALVIQEWLNLIVVGGSIVYFLVLRRYQYKLEHLIDVNQITQDDFTILVEDIPLFSFPQGYNTHGEFESRANIKFNYELLLKNVISDKIDEWVSHIRRNPSQQQGKHIEESFLNRVDNSKQSLNILQELPVRAVSLCYDVTELEHFDHFREGLMEKYVKDEERGSKRKLDPNSPYYIPRQIKVVNQEYVSLCKQIAIDESPAFQLSRFTRKAFVSLEYQHYRDYMLREYEKDKQFLLIEGQPIKISHATNPEDVFWFNMRVTRSKRIKSILWSYFILLMVLGFSFIGLALLEKFQEDSVPDDQDNADLFSQTFSSLNPITLMTKPNAPLSEVILGYFLTVMIPIATILINYLLGYFITELTISEKYQTRTDFLVSLVIKNVISQFINTAIIYFLIMKLYPDNEGAKYLSSSGIVVRVTSLVIASGVIEMILNLMQVQNLFKSLKLCCLYRNEEVNLFQIQLNKKLEDPEFPFADKYAYYIVQVYFVSFFTYIIPVATPILVLIFCVQYWIDKFNLFRRYSDPFDLNFNLTHSSLKMLEVSLVIYSVGNLIWAPYIHSDVSLRGLITILSVVVSLAYVLAMLLMPKYVERYLFRSEGEIQVTSYSQAVNQRMFKNDYWHCNPATMFISTAQAEKKSKTTTLESSRNRPTEKLAPLDDEERRKDSLRQGQVVYYSVVNN